MKGKQTLFLLFILINISIIHAVTTKDVNDYTLLSLNRQLRQSSDKLFEVLDLNHKGLEKVKTNYDKGDYDRAKKELLKYYKKRTSQINPDIDLDKIKLNDTDRKWAEEALEHKFFAHKGYQPSYFYGDDINWDYWPIKDNELRWQLHRHKWWSPMGKAFRVLNDETYAEEWTKQYKDWIEKNVLSDENKENNRFSWRPLEVSHRLQDQINQFQYFITSKHFNADFLEIFLINYEKHANHIVNNFSERGNHLLFEAQRLLYAGIFFPEFKNSKQWRDEGISILNREINVQVYNDGFQYELDPGYHVASINIFAKAYNMAKVNGYDNIFPRSYLATLDNMVRSTISITFPDYTMPCFSDSKLMSKKQMISNYKNWLDIFPDNKQLRYMATEGKKGIKPDFLSTGLLDSGFFTFRNGWDANSTVMIVKAGPPAFWHNQPDNGTFELYVNGRNFFPDAGSYVYGGDEQVLKERNAFRRTKVHNTLTLNDEDLSVANSETLLWDESNTSLIKLVTQNNSYNDLVHRRTVFFVDNTFFVIVDDAIGKAEGKLSQNFHLSEGKVEINRSENMLCTNYDDNNNIYLHTFGSSPIEMNEIESWVSYEYRQKSRRPGISFDVEKKSPESISYITVIYPFTSKRPKVELLDSSSSTNDVRVNLKTNSKKYDLQASW